MTIKQMLFSALILGATSAVTLATEQELPFGQTPLHIAASNGDVTTIKKLLKTNAEIDAKDKFGRTALHVTAESLYSPTTIHKSSNHNKNCIRSASVLLEKDNKYCGSALLTDEQTFTGDTAAHFAAEKCNINMLQLLNVYEHELNLKNKDGISPITLARKTALKVGFDQQAFQQCQATINYLQIYADLKADHKAAKLEKL